jgi:DNA-binding IclR family transcriptional regulator
VLFIERLSAADAVVNATIIGGRIPLPLSSSGMVLLAFATPELVDDVIAVGWPRRTRLTIADGDALRERLRHVRADGFAVLDGHMYEESRGIAVPVFGPHGAVYAAMGVVVPNDESSPRAAIELLTVAAAGVTHSLEEAYLPDAGASGRTGVVGPLVTTSKRSREYLEGLG